MTVDAWAVLQEFFVVVIGPVLVAILDLFIVFAICTGIVMFIHERTK
jgi:hypothetical protein